MILPKFGNKTRAQDLFWSRIIYLFVFVVVEMVFDLDC